MSEKGPLLAETIRLDVQVPQSVAGLDGLLKQLDQVKAKILEANQALQV